MPAPLLIMGALSLAPSLISGVTSLFKSRKKKKQANQMKAMNQQLLMRNQMMLQQMAGGNLNIANSMAQSYMQPNGMQQAYGPAQAGQYPARFA